MKTKVIDFRKHISSSPLVCHGNPCIKGTRIPVSTILGALAAGTPYDEVIREYPPVTMEDMLACFAFASELADYIVVDLPER